MSIEYVIENHKTKKSLYCTRAFGEIKPEHLVGDRITIEQNLINNLYSTDKEYTAKYAKWAAGVIEEFIDNATVEDIEIHTDDYFIYDDWEKDFNMYKSEKELNND
jgi:hypothetical protein